jgi:predicted enzyme related to lactoylglutathione lyase
MFQGLYNVIYNPGDLDKGKAWYSKILGAKPDFDQPFYVGYFVNGYDLGLSTGITKTSSNSGAVVYWGVENIAQAYARLLELGATVHESIEDVGEGILVASVIDPFGNILGIIQNPHFKLPSSG